MSQLNKIVKPYLEKYVNGNFTLNKDGANIVFNSNETLNKNYADSHNFGTSKHWYKFLKEKILYMPPKEFGMALDVCCGSGFVCLNIMKYELFETCYAIDINEMAISYLIDKARHEGIERIIPMHGNVLSTHFEDNYFDCVIGNSFLHHIPNNSAFFREAYRILKPGGVVCLTHEPSVSSESLEGFILRRIKRLKHIISKRHSQTPNKTAPVLSDIWVYCENDVDRMLRDTDFREYKIVSQGRISTIFGSFIERMWSYKFKRIPPITVFKIRSMLRLLDKALFSSYPKDSFSSFTIAARK